MDLNMGHTDSSTESMENSTDSKKSTWTNKEIRMAEYIRYM